MQTRCKPRRFEFEAVGGGSVVAALDGGAVSSDAGALLLGKAAQASGPIGRLAGCFEDRRDSDLVEHSVKMRVGQRVYIFCGKHLSVAKLWPSNIDASAESLEEIESVPRADPGPLAGGGHPAAGRFGLCARVSDELVRGSWRRLRLRPGEKRAPGGAACGRARTGKRGARRAARPRARSRTSATARSIAGTPGAERLGGPSTGPPVPTSVSSFPRCRHSSGTRARRTRSFTAPAAAWRTASRNSSSICSPTALRRRA